ncbi:phosphopantothenoylcysteine decarboxylase [Clonorchis sinensis]|uniref:Phosphopantothenoylcysteine decarboxylase n=1 Tax=Clonorchis sinensis TaxID=79923 RepID=G7YWC8_CLOSI|nr:phosphopantothenoylcysteine decarboxylase [Clonorchis sinensis]
MLRFDAVIVSSEADSSVSTRRLLLGVTASVAAIKTPLLVEQLTQLGFEIRVIATENSLKFFDPNDLSVRVFRDLEEWSTWSKRGDPILHIEVS